ncbi:MAG: hypothetical protein PHI98_16415, partial [Eubacteriales bacterium]|nr:hypothetical protein [Eubacteriales bacterium]
CYAYVCGFGVFSAAFSPLCCIIYDTNDAYNKRVPQNHFETLPIPISSSAAAVQQGQKPQNNTLNAERNDY